MLRLHCTSYGDMIVFKAFSCVGCVSVCGMGMIPIEVIFSYLKLFCNGALEVPKASVAACFAKPKCYFIC